MSRKPAELTDAKLHAINLWWSHGVIFGLTRVAPDRCYTPEISKAAAYDQYTRGATYGANIRRECPEVPL